MAATIRLVCDAVVAAIVADWVPTAPDGVERVYLPDTDEAYAVVGRRIFVFPLGQAQADIASRAEDRNEFRVGVMLVENYAAAGTPSREWCDERVDFFDGLYQLLGNPRTPHEDPLFPAPLAQVYPDDAAIVVSYDADELRDKKLFWSLMELTYRRDE